MFDRLSRAQLEPARKMLSAPGHKILPVKGQFKANFTCGDHHVEKDIFVVQKPLLGKPAIESLDMLRHVNTVQLKDDLKKRFPKLLSAWTTEVGGRVSDPTA